MHLSINIKHPWGYRPLLGKGVLSNGILSYGVNVQWVLCPYPVVDDFEHFVNKCFPIKHFVKVTFTTMFLKDSCCLSDLMRLHIYSAVPSPYRWCFCFSYTLSELQLLTKTTKSVFEILKWHFPWKPSSFHILWF